MMAQSRCHLLSIKAVPGTPSPQLAEEDLATLTGQHQPCPGRPPNHPSHGWPYDDHFRIETYGDLLGIPILRSHHVIINLFTTPGIEIQNA
jgi:hypothetical protein